MAHEFLEVQLGDYVAIKNLQRLSSSESEENYWFGKIIDCIGGARNPKSWTLFQVMNIDNGEITIVNADTIEKIMTRTSITKENSQI